MQNRKLLTLAALSFLFVHFALSLCFNFPPDSGQGLIQRMVFRYMFPVFNQNNKVFAPDPPFISQYMLLHYEDRGVKKSIDPGEQHRNSLHRFPFSPALYPLRAYEYRIAELYKVYAYADYMASRKIERDAIGYNRDSLRNTYLEKDSLYRLELNRCALEAGLAARPRVCSIGLYFAYHPEYGNFLKGKRNNAVLSYEFPALDSE